MRYNLSLFFYFLSPVSFCCVCCHAADFGFARFLQDGVMAATLCGSPMYMVRIVLHLYALFKLSCFPSTLCVGYSDAENPTACGGLNFLLMTFWFRLLLSSLLTIDCACTRRPKWSCRCSTMLRQIYGVWAPLCSNAWPAVRHSPLKHLKLLRCSTNGITISVPSKKNLFTLLSPFFSFSCCKFPPSTNIHCRRDKQIRWEFQCRVVSVTLLSS